MVIDKLKQIIAEQFGIDTDAISEDTDIVADLGADSLDVVEMMMALEEEYGITIDDSKIADLKTQYGTLYFAWGYNDVLYLRADRPLNKEKSSEQIRREREIEEFRTRREKMDELKKSAFELRYNFIKNYSVQDCKKNIEKVTDWLYFRQAIELMGEAMFDGFYNSSNCAKTFRTLFDCINGEDRPKLKEYIEKRPEKAFLYTIYAMWCDGEGNDCSDYSLHACCHRHH